MQHYFFIELEFSFIKCKSIFLYLLLHFARRCKCTIVIASPPLVITPMVQTTLIVSSTKQILIIVMARQLAIYNWFNKIEIVEIVLSIVYKNTTLKHVSKIYSARNHQSDNRNVSFSFNKQKSIAFK